MKDVLFAPLNFGSKTLSNRIALPPMTRSRATQPGNIANEMMATYYAQRASAGLVIAEGTQISQLGQGYAFTPGIYTQEQISGWKKVTEAVHAVGGTIFAQIWHVGRVTHPANTSGEQPISSSALQAQNTKVFISENGAPGFVDAALPREMTVEDIKNVVEEYRQAALNAIEAGFDGVEIHAANGYLVSQFIDSEANNRTDEYGGSIENRLRFLKEVVEATTQAIGAERVGVRFSPFTTLNDSIDSTPIETYVAAGALMNQLEVIYVHIAEADMNGAPETPEEFKQSLREVYSGTIIYAGMYDAEKAVKTVESGFADMIGFGRPFIANPDLPNRIKNGYPLAELDPNTLFGGDEKGLTDYPVYQ
ncbi:alkene reductase [Vibrio hannami]|uniref:alkene reductase n=1 Tax=Vibrio hannami TaxID=2717094 RepID=UPI00240FF381|nr:alkene reductase [Vibrio hannami]MDG3087464.1 alkene reductase [Vibrio hannami]